MKTRLFLAALAGVALVSCVTDKEYDVPAQNEKVKIAFDSPVMYDNNTRANYYGEIGEIKSGTTIHTYPKDEEFVVYAVEHEGDFAGWNTATTPHALNGKTVTYDPDLDGWADATQEHYWPAGKMSFAASSPADLENAADARTYGAEGLEITNFTVPEVGNQYDLMFSKRATNKTSSSMLQGANAFSGVPIEFQHALSSIHFSLRNTTEAEVILKKISLYGIHETGTFKEGINETKGLGYDRSESGNVTPEWEIAENAEFVSEGDAYKAFETSDSERGATFPKSAKYIADILDDNEADGGTNHALLLLPQELTDKAMLKVEYTINGSPATKKVYLKNALKLTADGDVSSTAITTWEMGTKYTYRLYYSAESASQDKIYFSPSSEGWKDAGVGVIELKNPDTVDND